MNVLGSPGSQHQRVLYLCIHCVYTYTYTHTNRDYGEFAKMIVEADPSKYIHRVSLQPGTLSCWWHNSSPCLKTWEPGELLVQIPIWRAQFRDNQPVLAGRKLQCLWGIFFLWGRINSFLLSFLFYSGFLPIGWDPPTTHSLLYSLYQFKY